MTTGSIRTATPRGLDSNAAEVVRPLELGEEARAVLTPAFTVQEYVTALVAAELFSEAAAVLAAVLPGREAVWWACLCARSGRRAAQPDDPALAAAEKWVREPSDASRRDAGRAAEAGQFGTPGALAALGAFFSGGSLAPPDVKQVVPPPEGGTTRVAATAVILAGVEGDPEKTAERFQSFVALGFEVARGRQGWAATRSGSFPAAR